MFRKPQIFSRRFSNGFSAYIVPTQGVAVQVELCIKTGSIHEGEHLGCGLAHYLEHMLFQGCRNYPSRSVSEAVSRLGGNINAYTSFDRTDYYINLPARHVDKAVDILCSMVRFPELPSSVCDSEKEVILRECDLSLDKPGTRVMHNLIAQVYQIHPVRVPVIGYKNMISNVTRNQLAEFHAKSYTPERAFFAIAGNVDPNSVFDKIEECISDWECGSPLSSQIAPEPEQLWKRESEFFFEDNLSRIAVGTAPGTAAKDIAAHNILWGALGMGSAGILPVKFMIENPIALDLRVFDSSIPGGGISAVSAVAKESDIKKLRSGILKELEKAANGNISASAVKQEKTQQYAEQLRRANDIENITAEIVDSVVQNGSPDLENSLFREIEKVTCDDVLRVAKQELDSRKLSVVIQHSQKESKRTVKPRFSDKEIKHDVLDNGCEVMTISDNAVPQISVGVILPAGPLFDPSNQTGLSSLAIRMLSTGTNKMSEAQLLTELDRCGADFDAQCYANSAICQLTAPAKYFKRAFSIFLQQLSDTAFDHEVFERERQKTLEELKHKELTPLSAASRRALSILTGNHPMSIGRNGSSETIANISADNAREHLKKMLSASGVKLGFSGSISHKEVQEYADMFSRQCCTENQALEMAKSPVFTDQSAHDSIALPREQNAVVMAFAGTNSTTQKNQTAIAVLRQLENGLNSRIFESVREDNSLAYSVGMAIQSGLVRGSLMFHAKTAKGKSQQVISLFKQELDRLRKKEISSEEFANAREQAAFSACSNLHNPVFLLPEVLLDLYYKNAPLTEAKVIERQYLDFTLDDFYEVFQSVFDSAVPVTVEAGNI